MLACDECVDELVQVLFHVVVRSSFDSSVPSELVGILLACSGEFVRISFVIIMLMYTLQGSIFEMCVQLRYC